LKPAITADGRSAEAICLTCGLCCNGVIFGDVRLQPGDDAARLLALGLPLTFLNRDRNDSSKTNLSAARGRKFPQPCAALEGCRCRIYAERPTYCREFECVLLKKTQAGHTPVSEALRVIRTARERADNVRRLLRELGDAEEHLALASRFRRLAKRLEKAGLDKDTALLYGQLTLAVHSLNVLLSEAFYPG
jgi:Fe-S-cluster containining protein